MLIHSSAGSAQIGGADTRHQHEDAGEATRNPQCMLVYILSRLVFWYGHQGIRSNLGIKAFL